MLFPFLPLASCLPTSQLLINYYSMRLKNEMKFSSVNIVTKVELALESNRPDLEP